MKSKRLAKLIALAVTALLLIGAAIGFSVSAETTAPELGYINVAFEGTLRLVYDVKQPESLAEGQQVAVLTWKDNQTEADATVTYADEKTIDRNDGTYLRFFSEGFAPKDMRKPLSAVAAIVDADGNVVAKGSKVANFSVYDFVMARFATASNTPDQENLYTALLDYGAAVQEVLYESEIRKGTAPETAKINAGLTYGYADEYYAVVYNKTMMVNGAASSTTTVDTYRPGEVADYNADNIYMGRIFAGYTDADGAALMNEGVSSRYYRNYTFTPSDVGYRTIINANYERATGVGTNETPFFSHKLTDLNSKSSNTTATQTGPGFSAADDTDGSGVVIEKTLRLDGKNGGNTGFSIKPDNATGSDVVVLDFDININSVRIIDNWAYIVLNSSDDYFVRLNLRMDASTGGVYLSTASEMCYLPRFSVSEYDENGKATAYVAYGTDPTTDTRITDTTGTPVQSLSGERVYYGDIENIRVEYYPNLLKEVDFEYQVRYTNAEDTAVTETRTTKVMAPTIKYYINGIFMGESYHGGLQGKSSEFKGTYSINVNDATKDVITTRFNEAQKKGTALTLTNASFTFFGAGAANITVDNMYYNMGGSYLTAGDVNSSDAEVTWGAQSGETDITNGKKHTDTQSYTVYEYVSGTATKYAKAENTAQKAVTTSGTYNKLEFKTRYTRTATAYDDNAALTKQVVIESIKCTPYTYDSATSKWVAGTATNRTEHRGYKLGENVPRYFIDGYTGEKIDALNGGSYTLKLHPNLHMDDNNTADKWDQVSVLDFDMKYVDLVKGNLEIGMVLPSTTSGDAYCIRYILSIPDENSVRFAEYTANAANMEDGVAKTSTIESVTFAASEVFNVRIELYQSSTDKDAGYIAKVYFNNVLKMTSDLVYKTANQTTDTTGAPKFFRLNYPNYGRGETTLENIYFYSTTVAETTN